jgi:hypothetical protein
VCTVDPAVGNSMCGKSCSRERCVTGPAVGNKMCGRTCNREQDVWQALQEDTKCVAGLAVVTGFVADPSVRD